MLPFDNQNGNIFCYTSAKADCSEIKNELELITGRNVILESLATDTLEYLLNKYYPKALSDARQQSEYYHGDIDGFLTHLINEARGLKSSDIHVEIFEENCRVRIRIDGMLVQRYSLEKKQFPSLVNKIKIIANLDIAEKRLPQDGRILFESGLSKFDIRVSVLPTLHGEKIVLRLLNTDVTNIDINQVGISPFDLKNYLEVVKEPNGILLISVPTGSGKKLLYMRQSNFSTSKIHQWKEC